jgi:hypothetical protein
MKRDSIVSQATITRRGRGRPLKGPAIADEVAAVEDAGEVTAAASRAQLLGIISQAICECHITIGRCVDSARDSAPFGSMYRRASWQPHRAHTLRLNLAKVEQTESILCDSELPISRDTGGPRSPPV